MNNLFRMRWEKSSIHKRACMIYYITPMMVDTRSHDVK